MSNGPSELYALRRRIKKASRYLRDLRREGLKQSAHVSSPVTSMSEDVQIREIGEEKRLIAETALKLLEED